MRQLITAFIVIISLWRATDAFAATFWVSPTGAATWVNCKSDVPLSGTAACAYTTANLNVTAGDTVFFRGGTYTMSGGNNYNSGVAPQVSGTSGNPIIYKAYAGETPVFTGGLFNYGVRLININYIVIDGIIFQNIPGGLGSISGNYNEVKNSIFEATAGSENQGGGFNITGQHTWFHHNIIRRQLSRSGACSEAVDLLRLGPASYQLGAVVPTAGYNTVENNLFYWGAHGTLATTGSHDVIRNNVFHNEPWISDCANGPSGKEFNYDTSSSLVTIPSAGSLPQTVNLTVSTGKSYPLSSPIGIIATASPANAMQGIVTAYNTSTGALSVFVRNVSGSGTISAWTLSRGNYPYYDNPAYNGMFGHRNIQIGDDWGRDGTFVILESNRIGNASNNPGNGGSDNLDLAAPKNIIRYNYFYNSMASGIYFKYASADLVNPILSFTSITIGTGNQTWIIPSGLHLTAGQTMRARATSDPTQAMDGTVMSYNSNTGVLMCNMANISGSGTYSSWRIWWNGGSGGVNNRVYNNTIYHNGNGAEWRIYGNENNSYEGLGIAQWNSAGIGSTANIVKNNIIYDNKEGGVCQLTLYSGDSSTSQCAVQPWDTITNNLISGSGDASPIDPKFTNPNLLDPTSQNLFVAQPGYLVTPLPDLSLQASSPAINAGAVLTQATGPGNNSMTLVVDDAMYFQDGTWGSDLARGMNFFPDWIAVGSVRNVVEIAGIDYATNTITLKSPLTWAADDPVWLYKKSDGAVVLAGAAPDIGAYEYVVSAVSYGDVSGDGRISMYDAALVLKYTIGGALTPAQQAQADMNGDAVIDAADAAAMAKKAVGLN